jgi:hypothetical protein
LLAFLGVCQVGLPWCAPLVWHLATWVEVVGQGTGTGPGVGHPRGTGSRWVGARGAQQGPQVHSKDIASRQHFIGARSLCIDAVPCCVLRESLRWWYHYHRVIAVLVVGQMQDARMGGPRGSMGPGGPRGMDRVGSRNMGDDGKWERRGPPPPPSPGRSQVLPDIDTSRVPQYGWHLLTFPLPICSYCGLHTMSLMVC